MSEQYRLIILPEAQEDIRSIILYIARELAVKVNAVIYVGRDQSRQMSDRKMEDL